MKLLELVGRQHVQRATRHLIALARHLVDEAAADVGQHTVHDPPVVGAVLANHEAVPLQALDDADAEATDTPRSPDPAIGRGASWAMRKASGPAQA